MFDESTSIEERGLEQNKGIFFRATDCVEFLDSLPFQTDELDDDAI